MADEKSYGERMDIELAARVRAQLADTPQAESGAASDELAMSLVAYPPTRTLDFVQKRFSYDVRSALHAAWMLGWQARHAQPAN